MKICIVGLGYVGLPLAVEFAKAGYNVIGYDVQKKKIDELKSNYDSMGEYSNEQLNGLNITYTSESVLIKEAQLVIIGVPTPITKTKSPDLSYLKNASRIVGQNLRKNAIVVYESTVYPGVTEDVCRSILELESRFNKFRLGYSPERLNPGDKDHTVNNIVKVVSAEDTKTLEKISEIYSDIVNAGVYKAPSIKVAEAAKVIENTQRDINIALMNELSLIFDKLNINTKEVIKAAGTKWNFLNFYPGLVGGHCIGVDPYYLAYRSKELGHHPNMILSGRKVNDYMPEYVALT